VASEIFNVELGLKIQGFLSQIVAAQQAFTRIDTAGKKTAVDVKGAFGGLDLVKLIGTEPSIINLAKMGWAAAKMANQIKAAGIDVKATFQEIANVRSPEEFVAAMNNLAAAIEKVDPKKIAALANQSGFLSQALSGLAGVILKAGGAYVGLRLLREVLLGVLNPNRNVGDAFAKTAAATGTMTAGIIGMIRQIPGLHGGLDKLAQKLQSTGINTSRAATSFNTLLNTYGGGNKQIKKFAEAYIAGFDAVNRSVKAQIGAIPGVTAGYKKLIDVGAVLATKFRTIADESSGIGDLFRGLSKAFAIFEAGALGGIPGVNAMALGMHEASSAASTLGSALTNVSPQLADLLGTIGNFGAGTLLGIDAIIGGVALGLAHLGDKLLEVTHSWAEASGESEQQLKLLKLTMAQVATQTDISLGSFEEWEKFLDELSVTSGVAGNDLTKIATRLINTNQQILLSKPQLQQLTDITARLGLQFHDTDRVLIDIVDAFVGMPGPLRRLIGVEASAAEISKLAAEASHEQADALQGIDNASQRAATAQQIFKLVVEGSAATIAATSGEADTLDLASKRLHSTISNLTTELGHATEPIFVKITNVITHLVEVVAGMPPALKEGTAHLIAMSGVVLKVGGSFLEMGSAVVGTVHLIQILNGFLGGTATLFGHDLGSVLSKLISSIVGFNFQVKDTGSAIKGLGVAAIVGFRHVEDAAGKALFALTNFKLGNSGALVAAFQPLIKVLKGVLFETGFVLLSLGQFATRAISLNVLISKLTSTYTYWIARHVILGSVLSQFILAVTLAYGALKVLNETFHVTGTLAEVLDGIMVALGDGVDDTGKRLTYFEYISMKLGQAFEFVAEVMALGFIPILITASALLTAFSALVAFLTDGFAKFTPRFLGMAAISERFSTIAHTMGAVTGFLGGKFVDLGNKTARTGLELSGFRDKIKLAAEQVKKDKATFDKVIVPELIKAAIDDVIAAYDKLSTAIDANSERTRGQIERLALLRSNAAEQEITDETQKVATLQAIEAQAAGQTIALELDKYNKSLALIQKRKEFETKSINETLGKDVANVAKRAAALSDIAKKSKEAELGILNNLKNSLAEQLKVVQSQQTARIGIIRGAQQEIVNIERGLQAELAGLKLAGLDEDQRQAQLRVDIARSISDINKSIANSSFDSAKTQIDEVKGLIGQIGADPNVTQAIQAAARLGTAETEREVLDLMDFISLQFGGRLPEKVQAAFDLINTDAQTLHSNLAAVQRDGGELTTALDQVGKQKGFADQAVFVEQLAGAQVKVQQGIININQAGLTSSAQLIENIQTNIATVESRISTLLNNIPKDLDIGLNLIPKDVEFHAKLKEMQDNLEQIDLAVGFSDFITMPDGSKVPVDGVGVALAKALTPPEPVQIQVKIHPIVDVPGGSLHNIVDVAGILLKIMTPTEGVPITVTPTVDPNSKQQAIQEVKDIKPTVEQNDGTVVKLYTAVDLPSTNQAVAAVTNTVAVLQKQPVNLKAQLDQASAAATVQQGEDVKDKIEATPAVIKVKADTSEAEEEISSFHNKISDEDNAALGAAIRSNAKLNELIRRIPAAYKHAIIALSQVDFDAAMSKAMSIYQEHLDEQARRATLTWRQLRDEARQARKDTDDSFHGTTQIRTKIDSVDIEGGSEHPLSEAGAIVSRIVTPHNPIQIAADLQTDQVTKDAKNFVQRATSLFEGIKPITFKANTDALTNVLDWARNQRVVVPIQFKAGKIDIPGGSLHPLNKAAEVIRSVLTPNDITASLQGAVRAGTGGINGSTASGGRVASIHRVDINVNNEKYSINTTDEESANTVTKIASSLKQLTRTRGEYNSPFRRGFSG